MLSEEEVEAILMNKDPEKVPSVFFVSLTYSLLDQKG
jgi:hypothetical protein